MVRRIAYSNEKLNKYLLNKCAVVLLTENGQIEQFEEV